jgi:hypothetical protein
VSQPVKVFEIRQDETPKPPIPFKLKFTRMIEGEVVETANHDFEAHGEAPAGAELALASMLHFGPHGEQKINMEGLTNYFRTVMTTENYLRLRRLLDDPELMIPMRSLVDVWQWLTAEYAGRPTLPSPASSDGRRIIEASATERPVTQG